MSSAGEAGAIQIEQHGDVAVLRLLGEHDLATVAELREQLDAHAARGEGIVVSLTETAFIDSSVVNTLFHADTQLREQGRRLSLHVATASIVRRVLDLTGLCDALPCSASFADALTHSAREESPA